MPESVMAMIVIREVLMPAARAASGLRPTIRRRKPSGERSMSHQNTPTAMMHSTNDQRS
jgi:hypothetical protein